VSTRNADAVNAFADDDAVIVAYRWFGWEQIRMSRADAAQLADQLYLLTRPDEAYR
jgi:hypothetical protein